MAEQYPYTWKKCATCAFWCGTRSCDSFGRNVTVGGPMEKGKCAIPSGPWKNTQQQANSSCSSWKKWAVLK